ncbi:MAG TPA: tyrosine-type recombinase/integrase [Opitutaceae bacterium]|nr:tyrosine-type recombinase/integrase [Opitutaceae bacterium]
MASLWKHPESRFWVACFTDAGGVQRKRSTRTTDRKIALGIAQRFESAYRTKLTEAQARKVISDIFEELHGEQLYHSTARAFLDGWLANKNKEMTQGSYTRYASAVSKFIAFLGDRADKDVAYVHKRDITDFRDHVAKKTTAATANTDLKILRSAFRQAVADGLRLDNPATAVSTLKERRDDDQSERRPFTEAELRKLFAVLSGEWRGIVLAGLYTGQRLGDIGSMTWRMIDLKERVISFRTRKTNRVVRIPIADSLFEYLNGQGARGSDDDVFPAAAKELRLAQGQSRRLSAQFHALLVEAGLAVDRTHKSTGIGRTGRRSPSELTFHSLRHNTTSWLKKAGVPESVVRDIIGHESQLVSLNYTHVDEETKRAAIEKLPALLPQADQTTVS